jgi:hypothetical protein
LQLPPACDHADVSQLAFRHVRFISKVARILYIAAEPWNPTDAVQNFTAHCEDVMSAEYFETEFGRRIDFVPGYFESNRKFVEYLNTHSHPHTLKVMTGPRWPWSGPAKDLVEFSGIVHFMKRFGLLQQRDRGIDLGGAEGTCAALFRSLGLVKHATNLDIMDFTQITGPTYFQEFVGLMKDKSNPQRQALEARIRNAKYSFDYFPEDAYDAGLYFGSPELAIIDENVHSTVEDATGKYDFVSAFSCFEHLDLDAALAKTRELLNDGGLFVCQNELWYWPVGSLGVIGHFPYAGSRLTHGDIDRYLSTFHPTLVEGYRSRVAQIVQTRQRPTIKDWFDIGRKHGLRAIAVERIMPRRHSQLSLCPPDLFKQPYFDYREVLADIHMYQPDVSIDDLMTSAIRIAMVKV